MALARCNTSNAVVADEAGNTVWEGRQAGWGGGQGGQGWRAGSGGGQGGVASRVGWRVRWGGGPGGQRGVDLWSKECSLVNIVT